MRKIYILVLVLLVSCSHFGDRKPAQGDEIQAFPIENGLKTEIEYFQELVEEALVWRSKSLQFAELHKDKFKGQNLSHEDMLALYESGKQYLVLREKILELAHRYDRAADNKTVIEYKPNSGTSITTVNAPATPVALGAPNTTQTLMRIDPTDAVGRDLLIRTKVSLSAALVLYDNYMIGIYPYLKNKKTRKMLNEDIPDFHLKLDKITDSFFDLENRNKIIRAIGLFKEDLNYKTANAMETIKEERYLEFLSSQSPFYAFISERHKEIETPGAFRAYFDRVFDRVRFMNDTFTFIASKVFGNTLGLVAFREGLLKNLSKDEKRDITNQMQPLDILLEKTPFRLTDQFIPGYYGHVAIWVGDESDLRALDLWDHPVIRKYQKDILAGKRIIEALRPGVQINSLEHFLNIDDLLVLRDNHLSFEQKREFIIRAFQQIGKEYDFNFDVETDSKIVCSEIVYVVFHDIDWPTKKALGRFTISPDNVASKAFDENDQKVLEPVLMYRSGVRQNGLLIPEIKDVLNAKAKTQN